MEYWKGSPLEGGQGGVVDGILEYWNTGRDPPLRGVRGVLLMEYWNTGIMEY